LTVQVAELGVPLIFCEKAMASSMAGADKVLAACREHGAWLNVGTSRRFDNRWHAVRKAIDDGAVGDLQGLQQFGGSSLMHGHIHTIDTMTYLAGDAPIARVRGDLDADTPPITDNHLAADPRCVSYQMVYANGVVATSVPSGGALEFEASGSEGALRTHNRPATEGMHVSLRADLGNGPDGKVDWEHAPYQHPEPFSWTQHCLEDLVASRAEGRTAAGGVEAAHAVTEACLAVAVSHARGGAWVDLPLVGADREMYVYHV
jgi:predicted dehydrogenase